MRAMREAREGAITANALPVRVADTDASPA